MLHDRRPHPEVHDTQAPFRARWKRHHRTRHPYAVLPGGIPLLYRRQLPCPPSRDIISVIAMRLPSCGLYWVHLSTDPSHRHGSEEKKDNETPCGRCLLQLPRSYTLRQHFRSEKYSSQIPTPPLEAKAFTQGCDRVHYSSTDKSHNASHLWLPGRLRTAKEQPSWRDRVRFRSLL